MINFYLDTINTFGNSIIGFIIDGNIIHRVCFIDCKYICHLSYCMDSNLIVDTYSKNNASCNIANPFVNMTTIPESYLYQNILDMQSTILCIEDFHLVHNFFICTYLRNYNLDLIATL